MWIDDNLLMHCESPLYLDFWIPPSTMVVMGSSNKEEIEVFASACQADDVPVLKRYGGGGTVVLHDGCVIASVGTWVREAFANNKYFTALNGALIHMLSQPWPTFADLEQKGISDIAWGDRKIAGTSLFRSRNYLLFQASLLVRSRSSLMQKYLQHPSKEPDYRARRSHEDFVLGLGEIVPGVTEQAVLEAFRQHGEASLRTFLDGELIAPVAEQFPHLKERMRRAQMKG